MQWKAMLLALALVVATEIPNARASAPPGTGFVRLDFPTLLMRYGAADRIGRAAIQTVLSKGTLFSATDLEAFRRGARSWRLRAMAQETGRGGMSAEESRDVEELETALGVTRRENPFQRPPSSPGSEYRWETIR